MLLGQLRCYLGEHLLFQCLSEGRHVALDDVVSEAGHLTYDRTFDDCFLNDCICSYDCLGDECR